MANTKQRNNTPRTLAQYVQLFTERIANPGFDKYVGYIGMFTVVADIYHKALALIVALDNSHDQSVVNFRIINGVLCLDTMPAYEGHVAQLAIERLRDGGAITATQEATLRAITTYFAETLNRPVSVLTDPNEGIDIALLGQAIAHATSVISFLDSQLTERDFKELVYKVSQLHIMLGGVRHEFTSYYGSLLNPNIPAQPWLIKQHQPGPELSEDGPITTQPAIDWDAV